MVNASPRCENKEILLRSRYFLKLSGALLLKRCLQSLWRSYLLPQAAKGLSISKSPVVWLRNSRLHFKNDQDIPNFFWTTITEWLSKSLIIRFRPHINSPLDPQYGIVARNRNSARVRLLHAAIVNLSRHLIDEKWYLKRRGPLPLV
jgi:hypothetical protein